MILERLKNVVPPSLRVKFETTVLSRDLRATILSRDVKIAVLDKAIEKLEQYPHRAPVRQQKLGMTIGKLTARRTQLAFEADNLRSQSGLAKKYL